VERSDEELMLRFGQGDDLAFNELVERWQQPLVRYIYRYVGSRATALDLAIASSGDFCPHFSTTTPIQRKAEIFCLVVHDSLESVPLFLSLAITAPNGSARREARARKLGDRKRPSHLQLASGRCLKKGVSHRRSQRSPDFTG
jgi:hypothetical protein